jgi:uncharacterized repeat protein (TIGR04052 family)
MKRNYARLGLASLLLSFATYGVIACDDDPAATSPTSDAGTDTSTPAQDSGSNVDSSVDAGPNLVPVTIKFKAKVGTQDFQCGTTYSAQGTTDASVEPADLRFFVQDVKLIDGTGTAVPVVLDTRAPWQTPDVALLDFENGSGACSNGNAELNDVVTGKVPAGTYTGIVFTNGVPESINHGDPATAPAPLTPNGMTWGWLLGHLFIKAEVKGANDAGGIGLFHLGSTGCANGLADGGTDDFSKGPTTACSKPNRNEVRLTGFNPTSGAVVFDVQTLFGSSDLTATGMMGMCHSGGAACPPLFANVGLEFDGGARLPTHPAFRVE